jgi:hypothetical protein
MNPTRHEQTWIPGIGFSLAKFTSLAVDYFIAQCTTQVTGAAHG